jgi:hypothetical protein
VHGGIAAGTERKSTCLKSRLRIPPGPSTVLRSTLLPCHSQHFSYSATTLSTSHPSRFSSSYFSNCSTVSLLKLRQSISTTRLSDNKLPTAAPLASCRLIDSLFSIVKIGTAWLRLKLNNWPQTASLLPLFGRPKTFIHADRYRFLSMRY